MNLLDLASEVMKDFDPSKPISTDFEELEDGTYNCIVEKIQYRQNVKGTEWINFDCTIVGSNRHIFINKFFTEKTAKKSLTEINKLVFELGYKIPLEAYATVETLSEVLKLLKGEQLEIEKKTSNTGFVNYKMSKSSLKEEFIPVPEGLEDELPFN